MAGLIGFANIQSLIEQNWSVTEAKMFMTACV